MFVIFMIEETENIRAVAEMKKEGKHLRGRQRLRWGGALSERTRKPGIRERNGPLASGIEERSATSYRKKDGGEK